MARIRTVKPELFRHEILFELERETGLPIRLSFIGLFTVADRDGLFKWRPRSIGSEILPYDDIDFSRVLDALATRGFVQKYEVNGEEYGCICKFKDHQHINNKEADSILPKPSTGAPSIVKFDASATREPRVSHAPEGEGKGKERKGKEIEKINKKEKSEKTIFGFEEFWNAYPSDGKKSKQKAIAAFKKINPDASILATMLDALQAQIAERDAMTKAGVSFIPSWKHAATWLNGHCWQDEVKSPREVREDKALAVRQVATPRKLTPLEQFKLRQQERLTERVTDGRVIDGTLEDA
jgi:hypothetical protein